MPEKLPVAVIAATGTVGQRFVSLLENHPLFKVAVVTASERSAGKAYREAARWVIPGDVPDSVADLIVQPTSTNLGDVALVFSALPTAAAHEMEPQIAAAGYKVFTNAGAMRMVEDVPLLIPDINPDHARLIEAQRAKRGWDGFIVASPNCSTTGIVFPLAALHRAFGVELCHAVTMQAVSGAGYPGVASLDILGNVMPYIKNEEEKLAVESNKMLGTLAGDHIEPAPFKLSAQANRVPVVDGHMAAISVRLKNTASPDQAVRAMREYTAPDAVAALPSGLLHPIIVRDEPDRPQPARDVDAGDGMAITIGRVKPCEVHDLKLVSLVHNTLRGAASGSILNAEYLVTEGIIN